MKNFWNAFEAKEFSNAQQEFVKLSSEEQTTILGELFQKSQYASIPHSVSVVFRELHDGKTFEDFNEAHQPPKDMCDPKKLYGETYQQFFKAPIRVINAVNLNNSKEIVSVGIHWLNEEQAQHFAKMMETAGKDEGNIRRAAAISKVAEQKGSGVFIVEDDQNLGTPF
ncbi:MAG: hypothetical protein EXR81_06010 [Gammaproteobacteria bacterium]|nr:hypothetical protein [Gammaproteobacteria bacterium]